MEQPRRETEIDTNEQTIQKTYRETNTDLQIETAHQIHVVSIEITRHYTAVCCISG